MTLFWLGLMNFLVGGLTIILAIPLAKGSVAKNNAYGIRFPQAMESEENWYAINRYGGLCLIRWCLPVVVIGMGLIGAFFWWNPNPSPNLGIIVLFALTPLLILGAQAQTSAWVWRIFDDGV